ncbi:MAG TPA: hypothetical protein VNF50_09820 [Acidimicrobiales bacterium]|nr:hypothetical protein [Acidimicrobiales bacterium]
MAQSETFRRYLDTGLAIGQITRARAEEVVKDLVKAGEVQREQTQQWIDGLVDRSRKNTELLMALVAAEVRKQLEASPLTSRRGRTASSSRPAAAKKTPAKKTPAKKAPAKKAPAKKTSPAKGASAKKTSAARKAPAKKAPGI